MPESPVKASTRLSPSVIALVGDFGGGRIEAPTLSVLSGGEREPLDSRWLALGDPGLLIFAMPDPGRVLHEEAALVWASGDGELQLNGPHERLFGPDGLEGRLGDDIGPDPLAPERARQFMASQQRSANLAAQRERQNSP